MIGKLEGKADLRVSDFNRVEAANFGTLDSLLVSLVVLPWVFVVETENACSGLYFLVCGGIDRTAVDRICTRCLCLLATAVDGCLECIIVWSLPPTEALL